MQAKSASGTSAIQIAVRRSTPSGSASPVPSPISPRMPASFARLPRRLSWVSPSSVRSRWESRGARLGACSWVAHRLRSVRESAPQEIFVDVLEMPASLD